MDIDFSDLIPAKPPAGGISFDDLIPKQADAAPAGNAAPQGGPAPPVEPDALQRIAGAGVKGAVEGFGHPMGQTILSPEAQDWMDAKQREGGVGGFLAGLGSTAAEDIGTAGAAIAGLGSGALRGIQGAAAQVGQELPTVNLGKAGEGTGGVGGYLRESLSSLADPQMAARDIAAGPEAFMGSPDMLARSPITAREVQARDGVPIMEAWNRAHAENTAAARPAEAIAAIGNATDIDGAIAAAGKAAEAPAATTPMDDLLTKPPEEVAPVLEPQSVGAAASRDMTNPNVADISTADMKANRRVAEMGEILAPPQSNDSMIYVPGSFPTLAERSGDPVVSQYENLLRQRKPDQFVGDGKILTENNKARVTLYDDNTVPDTTLNSMRDDRLTQWTADSKAILPSAKPVDFTPAYDWVQEQLNDPKIQENDAVRSVLENFRDRLVDDNGDLKTNPAAAWGMHDNLQNQLAKAKDPLNATSAERYAQSQILEAKGLVDQALNVATDNKFQNALSNYAEASKAINAGVLLNDFRPKLTNMSGELQPAAFHRFVVNLAKERGDPGIDPSMDISDQTMRALINIDTDMKRAGLIKLGAATNSSTNLLGALAEKAGLNAAHSIVSKVPVVGGLVSEGAKYIADRKLTADAAKHIAPPAGGYSYPPSGP